MPLYRTVNWKRIVRTARPTLRRRLALCGMAFVTALIAPARLSAQTPPAAAKRPITHEDVWLMKRVGAPVPSPDGLFVVFSVVDPAYDPKDQSSDLWLVRGDGSAPPRQLTFTKAAESDVTWSPDSRRIAFVTKREGDEVNQVYLLDVVEGGEARRVTSLSTGCERPALQPGRQDPAVFERGLPRCAHRRRQPAHCC
jgi:dipeptidyl aminopeptidase/acylaminoacyl peptidase